MDMQTPKKAYPCVQTTETMDINEFSEHIANHVCVYSRAGIVTQHRRLLEVGAHARGYNRCSIGICYEGGLDASGKPADTRTPEQKTQLTELLLKLHRLFPSALVVGHCDLPGVKKACPCFPCAEYRYLFH